MESKEQPLTEAQKKRIEQNKAKALQLRKSKVTKRPIGKEGHGDFASKIKRAPVEIDSGAGFFIEEEDISIPVKELKKSADVKVLHEPAPLLTVDNLLCVECDKEFLDSYLFSKFDYPACDNCRDPDDLHSMMTRTDAKTTYLLKDEDLDKREPLLKFLLRKNPHNSHWGDMKLYLHCQIKKRAMEVWGSEEKLEEAKCSREENREKAKQKKFNKKLKELRMSVRSSLWRKDLSGHQHEYGEEVYNEEEDEYSKTCTTCDHVWTYEKM